MAHPVHHTIHLRIKFVNNRLPPPKNLDELSGGDRARLGQLLIAIAGGDAYGSDWHSFDDDGTLDISQQVHVRGRPLAEIEETH